MKQVNTRYKMNKIVNKFLLAGDNVIPEMNLKQPGFVVLVDRLQKNKERIQKLEKTGDSQYIYQNKLDKAFFQHGMAYGDFKDITRRTPSDEILHDKAFNMAKIPKYDGYQRGFVSIVYK